MAIRRPGTIEPTATMNAAYAICMFANGSCQCMWRRGRPCDAVNQAARSVIKAAKAELVERRATRRIEGV